MAPTCCHPQVSLQQGPPDPWLPVVHLMRPTLSQLSVPLHGLVPTVPVSLIACHSQEGAGPIFRGSLRGTLTPARPVGTCRPLSFSLHPGPVPPTWPKSNFLNWALMLTQKSVGSPFLRPFLLKYSLSPILIDSCYISRPGDTRAAAGTSGKELRGHRLQEALPDLPTARAIPCSAAVLSAEVSPTPSSVPRHGPRNPAGPRSPLVPALCL